MEMWEIIEPFLYLGQRVKASTAGMGRHRGGSGYETLRWAWKTPFYEMQNIDHSLVHCHSGLWGGYPGSAGYRHNVRDTNMFELIEARQPYPTHDGNPEESNVERLITGRRDFDQHSLTLPEVMQQGDLYVCVYHGGDGLGDPIERKPEHVVEDLNDDFLLPRFAQGVYGVVSNRDEDGNWAADRDATERRRNEIRDQRRAKAVPVREWMKTQRERLLAHADGGGDFGPHLQRMYAESIRLSTRWATEFRQFWELPEDFDFNVSTPTVDISKAMFAQQAMAQEAQK
jgi:N-methylhydantoinase B/acetone carboxylase alpha subunit